MKSPTTKTSLSDTESLWQGTLGFNDFVIILVSLSTLTQDSWLRSGEAAVDTCGTNREYCCTSTIEELIQKCFIHHGSGAPPIKPSPIRQRGFTTNRCLRAGHEEAEKVTILLALLGVTGFVVWKSRVWEPLVYEEKFLRWHLVMTTNSVVGLLAPSLRGTD